MTGLTVSSFRILRVLLLFTFSDFLDAEKDSAKFLPRITPSLLAPAQQFHPAKALLL
jgi:hypothetical protein